MNFKQLVESPDYYLWAFRGKNLLFRRMDRGCFKKSTFTDVRIIACSDEIFRVDIDEMIEFSSINKGAVNQSNYIFHMAYGGSTLLAKALDHKKLTLVYREPSTLRQLGVAAGAADHGSKLGEMWGKKFQLALTMLGKAYSDQQILIVKANVPANLIIEKVLDSPLCSKALCLYSTLDNYMVAVLKNPARKAWVNGVFKELSVFICSYLGVTELDAKKLSVVEKAAALWLTQIRLFKQAEKMHSLSIRVLESEMFFNSTVQTLTSVFQFFGKDISTEAVEKIYKGKLFSNHSKNPEKPFDNKARLEMNTQWKSQLSNEIKKAENFIDLHLDGDLSNLQFDNLLLTA